jgi:hypothetical protein
MVEVGSLPEPTESCQKRLQQQSPRPVEKLRSLILEKVIQHHCFQMLFWCMFILSPLDYCVSSWSCSSTKIAILSTTAVGRTRTSPPTSDILTGCMCVWCALSNPGRIACVDCVENSVCVLHFSLVSSRAEKSTSDKLTRNREYLAVQVSRKYPW